MWNIFPPIYILEVYNYGRTVLKMFQMWISDEENGEPLEGAPQGSLSELKEEEDGSFPIWVIILVLIVLLVIIIAVIIMATRGQGEDYEE